ncbi:MAG TPA: hypothetical protein PK812_12725, partial [Beijerinckiaceae bacterium]|nr:hypothetical protein [Beijerinckiaceae bacterium]
MGHRGKPHRWMGCAAGALALAGLGAPAQAQYFFGPPVLPQRAVIEVLRDEGFRRISPPILNRDVYFLDAVDPYGTPVRLIVSAYNGDIIKAHLRPRGAWQEADPGWDSWDEPPPRRAHPAERGQKQAVAP